MEDWTCCACQTPVGRAEYPGVYRCGHFYCHTCFSGAKCPLDFSLQAWNDVQIATNIAEIQQKYQQNQQKDYFQAIQRLKTTLQEKFLHETSSNYSNLFTNPPFPRPIASLSSSFSTYQVVPDTWKCSICREVNQNSGLICKNCSGHRELPGELVDVEGKHWMCGNCGYKYNSNRLQKCANCGVQRRN